MSDLDFLVDVLFLSAHDDGLRRLLVTAIRNDRAACDRMVELLGRPHEWRVAMGITKS